LQTHHRYLELFLPPLFADLKCGHQLAEAEAGACISKLRDAVGARIFAGRLDPAQAAMMHANPNIMAPAQLGTPCGSSSGGGGGGGGGGGVGADAGGGSGTAQPVR
jgi:hypothetical protein